MLLNSAPQEEGTAETDVLAAAAALLFASGETTRRTMRMIALLGGAFGIQAELLPAWGALTLRTRLPGQAPQFTISGIEPLGVDMNKVAQTERLICSLPAGGARPAQVRAQLEHIAALPPASTRRFVVMCAAASIALGVIFGVGHPLTLAAIGLTAAVAAIVRRAIAHFTEYPLVQPLVAAFVNGLGGAIAAHAGIQNAQWVAVAPCIILVPGPHLLNGALDLARGHAVLGAGRIAYATVVVLMICIGLLVGLGLGGTSLPVQITMSRAPFALDVLAAGIAVSAFGSFFSMPWKSLGVPVAIGMLAHSIRWSTMLAGGNLELATFAACLTVGVLVTLLEERLKMPFAAMAFAASVSMIPGFYLFHMASGLVSAVNANTSAPDQFLMTAILNGTNALIISIIMAFGLIAPKMCIEHFRAHER